MDSISFDLDGVLYMWTEVVYPELVEHHGLTQDYDTFWKASLTHTDGYNEQFWYNILRVPIFYSARKADPLDVAVLNILSSKYNIYYVTSRPDEVALATKNWLIREKFPNVKNLIMGRKKVDVIKELGIKWFIEDQIDQAENFKDYTNVIIKNTPWNKDCPGYRRVNSISELLRIL